MKKITTSFLTVFVFSSFLLSAQQPEVSITTGHSGIVMRVAIAPTGNLIASNGADHLIKVWDKSSGKEITTLSNKVKGIDNEQRLESLKFFDDGKHLLTTDENGSLKVWNIRNETIIRNIETAGGIHGLSADISGNKIVFLTKDYSLAVTEIGINSIKTFPELKIRILKINPENPNEIFAIDLKNNFFMYDYIKKVKTVEFEKNENYLFNAALSHNGKHLAVVFSNMTLKIWNTETGALIKELKGIKPANLTFHPITDELVILNQDPKSLQNTIYIFDNKGFELKRKIENIGMFASFMTLSGNGKLIAVNSMITENNTPSYTINLLNWRTGKLIKTLKSKAHTVWQIEAAKNSPRIASLGGDLNLRIWNISTLQIESVFKFIQKIAINPEGTVLAMYGYHKNAPGYSSIALLDLDSMKIKGYLPITDILSDINFCADNEHIITSNLSSQISVWNLKSKKKVITIQGNGFGMQNVDISKNLKYIAYGSSGQGGISIYNTESKKTINIEDAHKTLGASDLQFSSDGKYLLSGSFDKEVIALKTGTWEKVADYTGNIGPVSCVSYNFTNNEVASGSMGSAVTESDYAVNVWEKETGNHLCKLLNHKLAVTSVAFNEKNHLLFSGSNDGTIKIWSLDSCQEIMSCIAVDFDDYIFITSDYYYTGSKDALKGVGFKMNGTKLYPFEQYDLRLNRPDIIAERLNIAPQNLIKAFKRAYQKRLEKMGYDENSLNNDFNLPKIEIKNKNEIAFQSSSNELSLQISAKDDKYLLNRINIWINDVPIYGRKGIDLKKENSKKTDKKIKIALSEGKNKIQLSVLNEKGAESLKETIEILAPKSIKKPDLYLVAIGVSDYFNDEYDLNYAAKDANDLSNIFETKKDKFNNIHIIKVLDHDATKENILKTKEELLKTNINDLVIIYTAGHGFLDNNLDYFFATTDIDVLEPEKKGLSYAELESLLEDIPARKKLLLMDACHSGEIDYDEYDLYIENMSDNVVARNIYVSKTSASHIGLDNSFRLMKELFADLRRGSGAVVIASAGGVEYAFESDELKNGVFTYVLINALKLMKANSNTDKIITISELQKYVMKTVSQLTGGKQNPTTRRENLEFDFEIW